MFDTLFEDFEALRKKTARFRRVALHIHSPNSHDWGTGSKDKDRNARERFDAPDGLILYSNELKQHVELAAITDHMRCGFATQLANIDRLANDEFAILPGMEVNICLAEPLLNFARIHLLAILPEKSTSSDFACLFRDLPDVPKEDSQRSGNEEITGVNLSEFVARVHGAKGICIAAHVENAQGIRYRFLQAARDTLRLISESSDDDSRSLERDNQVSENLKEYLFDSRINAIEIHQADHAKHYRWVSERNGQIRSIATLLTFDAHCCEHFSRREKITHIKMTSLTHSSLRDALRFPDTRIRYPANLPTKPNPRILGISITGDDESFFSDVRVALAENLNCLIGPRGSGKSTIVEALRYVFGYNRTLGELGQEMGKSIRDLQSTNLRGSLIRVAYQTKADEIRILSATFDEKSEYSTKVYNRDGTPVEVADVEKCGNYPLRLFGWSEIETLGRNPGRQRELMDRLIPEIAPLLHERSNLYHRLAVNRGDVQKCISDVTSAFQKNDSEIKRYKEYQADFEKLNTPEVKDLFANLDAAKEKLSILHHVKDNADTLAGAIQELLPISLTGEVDDLMARLGDAIQDWWLKDATADLKTTDAESDVKGYLQRAIQRLRQFEQLVDNRIETATSQLKVAEQGLQETLSATDAEGMQRITDLRTNAKERLDRVTEIRQDYLNRWNDLQKTLQERRAICAEVAELQDRIAGVRARHNNQIESTLNDFLPASMTVEIDFRAGGEKRRFEEILSQIVPGRSNNRQVAKRRRVIRALCNPVSCAALILDDNLSTITERTVRTVEGEEELTSTEVKAWLQEVKPFDYDDDFADVHVLAQDGNALESLLNLQETKWDDYEAILLDGGPVNEKSPGQRSSAMLPLIALAEGAPLVIDQPEDNLDKRLIGNVLTKVLTELKEKRQITVCTHDPNILVGGDAEQVIVLDAESNRRGKVTNHGSIDCPEIVQTVIDLLEGGQEAFDVRKKRYQSS